MTDNATQNAAPGAQPGKPASKWRWARRIGVGVVLVGLGLASGAAIGAKSVQAHFWRGLDHSRFDAERVSERIDRRVERILSRVDGTPEQQQRIATIAKSALNDLVELGVTPRETRAKFIELLRADTVDAAALEALRAEQVAKIDAGSKRMVRAVTDVAAVLTPAQRRELTERMQERHSRWR